jgi:tetratricopeptide (TPR) repeat protein/serine phosphatase RsbU (regulator of sigma subunit)
MNLTILARLAAILLLLSIACEGGKKSTFQLPPDLGRGLTPADSLQAVLNYLRGQEAYEAETLRFHYMYEYIRTLARQRTDTLPALVQELWNWAQKSKYLLGEGVAALGEAQRWWSQGQYDSALSRAQTALRIFQEKERLDYEGKTYHLIGLIHYAQGRHAEALEAYQKALAIRERIDDQQGIASSYNNIGLIHAAQGQYAKALEAYQKALAIRERTGDQQGIANCYNNIGTIHYAQGRYAEALESYQKALAIQERIGDQQGIATSYNNIGIIHETQGRYAEALESYQKALTIRERIDDQQGIATSYNSIGIIHYDQGRYAEALEAYQKALTIRERIGDLQGIANCYNNIGIIHKTQGRYAEALEAYQKALTIQERIGDLQGIAASYNNIGSIHNAQGRYAQALEAYQKALTIYERIGDQQGIASSYNGIGIIHAEQGRYAEALEAYQKALAIFERIGDQQGIAICYNNIGDIHYAQGRYAEALEAYQKALAIAQSLGLQDYLDDIYLNLAKTDSALAASGLTHLWKSAYLHHRLYAAYKDSVRNEESIRKQAQLESQYEYEKKTALLKAEQEKERALATAQLRQRETQRNLSLLALGIALIGLITFAILYRKIRQQRDLIQKQSDEIQQKNFALEQYNAELKATNQALEESNRIIQQQAETLLEKNQEILDSIRYAERIQQAILPSAEKWQRLLPQSFLLYKPRDIVAGDFYWLEETEHYIFLGVADATGHGVPGAFVSIVCANALYKAVLEEGLESPAEILWRVREVVVSQLTQAGEKVKDGMDIALIRFAKEDRSRAVFAGANRPLWIVSAEGLLEVAGTRQPIGYVEEPKAFEEVELMLGSRAPAMVYAFTDGIVDQMGGPKGRKLLPKGLREWLSGLWSQPVAKQAERLTALFETWRGDRPQIDDVTVVGVRIS